MKIGYVGMSHLGLVSCVGTASKGFQVIGFDKNFKLIENLSNSIFSIEEPNFLSLFETNKTKIKFTANFSEISECDLIYISQDVSSDESGASDLREIENLINETVKFTRRESCIVILSQVSPGFSRKISKKMDMELIYQVETLIFGSAVDRFLYPERFIVGMNNPADQLHHKYKLFLKSFGCEILEMSYESAELCKISINVFLATSITTTNFLCELAEKIGANWDDIKKSLKLDQRIGPNSYIEPGLGISGGNIERDLRTADNLSKKFGTHGSLLAAIENNSMHRKLWPYRIVEKEFKLDRNKICVAIWGLTYKKNTHSIKNSPAIANMEKLSLNCKFHVYDPIAKFPASLNLDIQEFSEKFESLYDADVLIIFNDSNVFCNISAVDIEKKMKGKLVIDPLGIIDTRSPNNLNYFKFGANYLGGSN
jgi:UDPglucose 6-dehydrogenase